METVNKILPLIFYVSGSVCFLIGSIISIIRTIR